MTFITTQLGMAYRKAKVDLYYSSLPPLLKMAEYERNLVGNLNSLLTRLNGIDEAWVTLPDFLGGWTLATKSIDQPEGSSGSEHGKSNGRPIFSSPHDEWEALHAADANGPPKKGTAWLRLMADVSLDFHVLSALWMLEVGHRLDERLSGNAYGSRLRRTAKGEINALSLGSFKPYFKPFRDWRDGGITAMQKALREKKKVVALTADVASFYHELNPAFMRNPDFLINMLGLELTDKQHKLNRLFITALEAWAMMTPLRKGLPVGLPASAVVANMALIALDRLFEREVGPLYYGRHVDDILLVMENGADFKSAQQLWDWLFKRAPKLLRWTEDGKSVQFCPPYLEGSRIVFGNDKNKVFLLHGESGETLVESIAQHIHQRASEWRALPNLPRNASHVATALAAATQSDGDAADNLRKTSSMSMKRAGFAIKLRDFEAYERDLEPEAWKVHRHAFLRALIQHVLVPETFFDLSTYLPRVVRLATACEDFELLRQIIECLDGICKKIEKHCDVCINACPSETQPAAEGLTFRWRNQLFSTVRESIIAALPPRMSKEGKAGWKLFERYAADHWLFLDSVELKSFQVAQALLFSCDLAHMPFRFVGLPPEMISKRGIPTQKALVLFDLPELVHAQVSEGCRVLARWVAFKSKLPQALLFATRPYSLAELFVVAGSHAFEGSHRDDFLKVVLALRGFSPEGHMPHLDQHKVLQVPRDVEQEKLSIAVTSWQTQLQSWAAAATRRPDPDEGRYWRLTRLMNEVISRPVSARYLILPELSLPAYWFMRIAQKLHGRGISLIAGIEYLHAGKGRVRNQVWAALSHDGLGFPSMLVYRQDKQRPALHEEQELQRLAGLEMRPGVLWKTPPVIQHGDFRFSLLVCSELTNIEYRASLRGEVDAIFVPEWNPDIDTFNALVESAALDVHAYIIQCNDRAYGDSRIRSPHKNSWGRDILRVRGGRDDYCIAAEIDVHALRQFQSSHRSADGPFKPVPDGFMMSQQRQVLPKAQ